MNKLRGLFQRNGSNSFKGADSFCAHLSETGLYNSEQDVIANYDSLVSEMKDWVQHKGYTQAEALLDLVSDLKDGKTRQDGITPSALHEMTQAIWFISAIEGGLEVESPEGVLSVIFAHDIGEDFGMTIDDMNEYLDSKGLPDNDMRKEFLNDYDLITKAWGEDGEKRHKNNYEYYLGIQQSRNASVAKMFDRAHNIMTLVGVKDVTKMNSYIASTMQIQDHFTDQYCEDHPQQAEMYKTMAHVITKELKTSRFYTANSGVPLPDDDELNTALPEKGFKDLPVGLHPIIIPAERIRATYPETHLAHNPKRYTEIKYSPLSVESINDNDATIQ